jgi:NADPH:quinone reductase-like Zn-dependent oxidoreductase
MNEHGRDTKMATVAKVATEVGTMKALVQEGYGTADVLHLRDIDLPTINDSQVLVRVRAASANALDWHGVHGGKITQLMSLIRRRPQSAGPDVSGVDVAGVVEAIGKNVTRLRPGDEVFGNGRGTFAEFAVGSERGLIVKPAQLPFEQAAAVGVAGRTALQAVRDHGRIARGDRVLVLGAGGGVGTFTVQIAKALGARVAAVTGARNVDLIRSLGADEVFEHGDKAYIQRRYDAVLDVAATRSLLSMRGLLEPSGRLVLLGAGKKGGLVGIVARVAWWALLKRFDRRMTFFVAKTNPEDLMFLRDLIVGGKIRVAIDRTYLLKDAAQAVAYLGTGTARAKVVVKVS